MKHCYCLARAGDRMCVFKQEKPWKYASQTQTIVSSSRNCQTADLSLLDGYIAMEHAVLLTLVCLTTCPTHVILS